MRKAEEPVVLALELPPLYDPSPSVALTKLSSSPSDPLDLLIVDLAALLLDLRSSAAIC
jgi:hypothetical protein